MSSSSAAVDPLLDCLSLYERRFVVEYLRERDGEAPLEDVERALLERTAAEEEQTEVAREQVSNALHDRHLPRLVDNEIVAVRDGTVELQDDVAAELVDVLEDASGESFDSGAPAGQGAAGSSSGRPPVTREKYTPEQDRTLVDAILDAIERHRDGTLSRNDFELFENVNYEAMDELFRTDASATTRLSVTAPSVELELWGDDGVQIRVANATRA